MRFQRLADCSLFILLIVTASSVFAQPQGFNYDESKVPTFTLPDPLVLTNGDIVVDAKTWQEKRR
ncbi:MAG: hypothetical protein KDB05_32190, partial [Planctomycetales bacterium]|nr:hypothetical protein [Planctomycetales bacterium]